MFIRCLLCSIVTALGKDISVHVESYDWYDNRGNADIAYPTIHNKATEGKGTWSDPVTFAGNKRNFSVGSRVYLPYLQKYFVMEDQGSAKLMNIWLGPSDASGNKQQMSDCESKISLKDAIAVIDPSRTLKVDTTPLYSTAGGCSAVIHPITPTPPPAPTPPPPGPTPPPTPAPGPGDATLVTLTFYGARDNCPPGGDIAYPKSDGNPTVHDKAGGTGSWADPITFAGADPKQTTGSPVTIGQRVYVPHLQKYFCMEDECEECTHNWKKAMKIHIDLFIGPSELVNGSIIACEDTLTPAHQLPVLLSPNATMPTDLTPLWAPPSACIVPEQPCKDVGVQCGNECQTPETATCAALDVSYFLPLRRFAALNFQYGLNCTDGSTVVPEGKTVCMGGTCGG